MPEPTVIGPGIVRQLGIQFFAAAMMTFGAFLMFGFGTWLLWFAVVVGCLAAAFMLAIIIRQRPRLRITEEGFDAERLFGVRSYRWSDIDGAFAVIKIGFVKAVGFNLTEECKARLGKTKKQANLGGYDEAIAGAYQLSPAKLVELLNQQKEPRTQ